MTGANGQETAESQPIQREVLLAAREIQSGCIIYCIRGEICALEIHQN
jgi:hypothetical protein